MEISNSEMSRCAVIILAGGLGTRLRAVTGGTPKPLVAISGRPFLEYLLDHLRGMGFEDLFVTASYRRDLIRASVDLYAVRTSSLVRTIDEPTAAGTFGAVIQAERAIPAQFDTFLILNGDSLVDGNYGDVFRGLSGRDISVGGVDVDDCARYGRLTADADGRLRHFAEKSHQGFGTINAGIYALRRSVLNALPVSLPASMELDFMPRAVGALNVGLVRLGAAPFIDIGTPESYASAQQFALFHRLRPA